MDPCKEALLSHLVKLCVQSRADGQRLCPNFDNICVRQRRKSLYFNERRDNIYVPHQAIGVQQTTCRFVLLNGLTA